MDWERTENQTDNLRVAGQPISLHNQYFFFQLPPIKFYSDQWAEHLASLGSLEGKPVWF